MAVVIESIMSEEPWSQVLSRKTTAKEGADILNFDGRVGRALHRWCEMSKYERDEMTASQPTGAELLKFLHDHREKIISGEQK